MVTIRSCGAVHRRPDPRRVDRRHQRRAIARRACEGRPLVPNPILNDKTVRGGAVRLGRAAGAEPRRRRCGRRPARPPAPARSTTARSARGAGVMTVRGSITATAVLFVLLLASATVGWMSTDGDDHRPGRLDEFTFPGVAMVGVIVGFVASSACYFKPHLRQVPRPDLRHRRGLLRRRDLQGLRDAARTASSLQAAGATLAVFARDARCSTAPGSSRSPTASAASSSSPPSA